MLSVKKDSAAINEKAEDANSSVEYQLQRVPNSIFIYNYTIDSVDRQLDLRKLFEIDVTELSELTLSNLRVQLEKISSIRLTLARAYEQLMEDYGKYKVQYDIWYASEMENARNRYWAEQAKIQKDYDLAKSGMKPPTQDDLFHTMLRMVGCKVEYESHQERIIFYQRGKSLYEKVDEILHSREFTLKAIIEMRATKQEAGLR
jgi:hypothetical protein